MPVNGEKESEWTWRDIHLLKWKYCLVAKHVGYWWMLGNWATVTGELMGKYEDMVMIKHGN